MDSKLRIGVIGIEGPDAGGAYSAESQMVARLCSLEKECEVIYIQSGSNNLFIRKFLKGIEFLSQLRHLLTFNQTMWFLIKRFSKFPISKIEKKVIKARVDLVFFVGQYDLAVQLRKTPFIVTIWDLGHRDLPQLPEMSYHREFEYREWRIRNIASKASWVVVDSEVTKEKLYNIYGIRLDRIVTIPFTVKPQSLQSIEVRENFAYYPAHFWAHKNHSILLYAIHALLEKNVEPRKLIFTGQDRGNKSYIDKLVCDLGIQEYVQNLGFLPSKEVEDLYKKAAVTVMPSILGPTNFPPLEALSFGCPAVVSSSGSANLQSYNSILEIDPFEITAWSRVLTADYKLPLVDQGAFNLKQEALEEENINLITTMLKSHKKMLETFR
jgi:glycosyltransferase involved in cell wall biosynthesis